MKSFFTWCTRYLKLPTLLVIAALVYILFLQDNSIAQMYEMDKTIDSLKQIIAMENDTMEFYRAKNMRLDNNDPEIIEQVVREQHNMSLPTEEVYVFKK